MMNYRRITDYNGSLFGLDRHLSFEACFYFSNSGAIIFSGRVIESNERELFASGDLTSLNECFLESYKRWNPLRDLEAFLTEIEAGDIRNEPAWLVTPNLEMSLEVQGPVGFIDGYKVVVNLPNCLILGEYHLKDTGLISVTLLCKKECLLQFLRNLHTDLLQLLSYKNEPS